MENKYDIVAENIDCKEVHYCWVPELQGDPLEIAKEKAMIAYK